MSGRRTYYQQLDRTMDILPGIYEKDKTRKSYSGVAWFYDFRGRLTESKAAKKVLELAGI